MTNTTAGSEEVFKVDARGRVQTQRARREELLDEFERSGASGQAFAKLVGIKYQTFASWVQKRRRTRGQHPAASTVKALPSTAADALRLVEAVVERDVDQAVAADRESLCVHLPGGVRVEVRDGRQARLAAELLQALTAARPC